MDSSLVECVPNFSEGRDRAKMDALAEILAGRPGVALLDRQADIDHNRSVFTFAGSPAAVRDAAVELAGRAAQLIDLNQHHGAHPRIGALDVLPFVPLRGVTLTECAELAAEAGEEIWRKFGVPSYLYESAARRPERRNLAQIRRGGFERLRQEASTHPGRQPDIGGPGLHASAGAVASGARQILIAYNIQLATQDVSVAKRVATRIRESSGGLPDIKAMGLFLPSRDLAQVSMNLTNFRVTPPHVAFEAVRLACAADGVAILTSELIGLIPQAALDMAAGLDLRWENLTPDSILENRLAAAGLLGPAARQDGANRVL